jgi:hypothetical protein
LVLKLQADQQSYYGQIDSSEDQTIYLHEKLMRFVDSRHSLLPNIKIEGNRPSIKAHVEEHKDKDDNYMNFVDCCGKAPLEDLHAYCLDDNLHTCKH